MLTGVSEQKTVARWKKVDAGWKKGDTGFSWRGKRTSERFASEVWTWAAQSSRARATRAKLRLLLFFIFVVPLIKSAANLLPHEKQVCVLHCAAEISAEGDSAATLTAVRARSSD